MMKYVFVYFSVMVSACSILAQEKAEVQALRVCVANLDGIQKPYREKIEDQLAQIAEGFKEEFSTLEATLKKEKSELDEIKQKLQKNPKMPEPEGFQQRLKTFEKNVQGALKKEENKRQVLQQMVADVEMKFSEGLKEALKEVSDQEGYDLILPRGGVLEAKKSLDCTAQVESRLSLKSDMIFDVLKVKNG
jgi:Skp family chaperone for outer membrane proteins